MTKGPPCQSCGDTRTTVVRRRVLAPGGEPAMVLRCRACGVEFVYVLESSLKTT